MISKTWEFYVMCTTTRWPPWRDDDVQSRISREVRRPIKAPPPASPPRCHSDGGHVERGRARVLHLRKRDASSVKSWTGQGTFKPHYSLHGSRCSGRGCYSCTAAAVISTQLHYESVSDSARGMPVEMPAQLEIAESRERQIVNLEKCKAGHVRETQRGDNGREILSINLIA